MADFVEADDLKFADQLVDFGEGLNTYGNALGFNAQEIQDAQDDGKFFSYVMGRQSNFQNSAQEFTGFKNLARYGLDSQVMPSTYPAAVVYPVPQPVIRPANIEQRFRANAAKAKAASGVYTQSIGETLHIVAPQSTFDPLLGKPKFSIILSGGHPLLKWVKGKFQGVEIWVNRGTGWKKLERDFSSPFVDKFMLPAGQSAVWKYKMIYVLDDETIGEYSDEATVTVYGDVMAVEP